MTILPVVVLYNKTLDESESVCSLIAGGGIRDIFVYNNSPLYYSPPCKYKGVNVHFINDFNNSGVSRGYNEGFKKALELNYTHVLLVDQDTIFPNGSLNIYISELKKQECALLCPILVTKNGAICSPVRYLLHRGFSVKNIKPGIKNFSDYSPINSGILVDAKSAIACGGYNERVFLDFSDFQFIERFRIHHKTFKVIPLVLTQDFSGDETNMNNLLSRFRLYCICAQRCEKPRFIDRFIYFFMVSYRSIKLSVLNKSLSFLTCFIKNYIGWFK